MMIGILFWLFLYYNENKLSSYYSKYDKSMYFFFLCLKKKQEGFDGHMNMKEVRKKRWEELKWSWNKSSSLTLGHLLSQVLEQL